MTKWARDRVRVGAIGMEISGLAQLGWRLGTISESVIAKVRIQLVLVHHESDAPHLLLVAATPIPLLWLMAIDPCAGLVPSLCQQVPCHLWTF